MAAHPGSGAALGAPHPLLILAACINGCALDGNLVRQKHRLIDRMGDEQHRLAIAFPDIEQIVLQSRARVRVQRAERLVHQEAFGVIGERAGQRHALLHAARQLLGMEIRKAFQAHHFEQRAALRFGFCATDALLAQTIHHVAKHVFPGKQGETPETPVRDRVPVQ